MHEDIHDMLIILALIATIASIQSMVRRETQRVPNLPWQWIEVDIVIFLLLYLRESLLHLALRLHGIKSVHIY